MTKNQPNTPSWARGAIGQMGMRPEVMAIWTRQDIGENERLEEIFKAGRSSMQSEAAQVAESVKLDYPMVANERRTQEKIAAAIRALKP